MRKILLLTTLIFGAISVQAQEKVMKIMKTVGENTQIRVADLEKISFLTVDEIGHGLMVKTSGDQTTSVLFESNPVVTVSDGKLLITSNSADVMEFEITNIQEIVFGVPDASSISKLKGFECVVQDGCILLRGIPKGVKPHVYAIDGRSLPTPPMCNDELTLSRATLGSGIFIVKVGTFSTKIHL